MKPDANEANVGIESNRELEEKHKNPQSLKLLNFLPPYRIYIYDLPSTFNDDIVLCHTNNLCYDISGSGQGKVFSSDNGIKLRNTWHGALDLTIHYRLSHSVYRTKDPEQADVFYVPYYAQMLQHCTGKAIMGFDEKVLMDLYMNITKLPYFVAGKPHFTTLGQPEGLFHMWKAPKWIANILYIVLEKAHQPRHTNHRNLFHSALVAPYPAYGHFTKTDGGAYMNKTLNMPRKVHVFFAGKSRSAGLSRSKAIRDMVVKQMPEETTSSFQTFYKRCNNCHDDVIWFWVDTKCTATNSAKIVGWMQNSVFCLQPPGDTATRKSFFDSVISGCIPVIFEYKSTRITYPFDTKIDYRKFTVMIPANKTFTEVLDPYRNNTDAVDQLQKNLSTVAKYLQYNDNSTPDADVDAFHLLMQEVGEHFGLLTKQCCFNASYFQRSLRLYFFTIQVAQSMQEMIIQRVMPRYKLKLILLFVDKSTNRTHSAFAKVKVIGENE